MPGRTEPPATTKATGSPTSPTSSTATPEGVPSTISTSVIVVATTRSPASPMSRVPMSAALTNDVNSFSPDKLMPKEFWRRPRQGTQTQQPAAPVQTTAPPPASAPLSPTTVVWGILGVVAVVGVIVLIVAYLKRPRCCYPSSSRDHDLEAIPKNGCPDSPGRARGRRGPPPRVTLNGSGGQQSGHAYDEEDTTFLIDGSAPTKLTHSGRGTQGYDPRSSKDGVTLVLCRKWPGSSHLDGEPPPPTLQWHRRAVGHGGREKAPVPGLGFSRVEPRR
ncbi:unnamed protein product [Lampetra planeri]